MRTGNKHPRSRRRGTKSAPSSRRALAPLTAPRHLDLDRPADDAFAQSGETREAAKGFAMTIRRLDFSKVSRAELDKLLGLVESTFSGHDRVQALFGLLDSPTFLDRVDSFSSATTTENRQHRPG